MKLDWQKSRPKAGRPPAEWRVYGDTTRSADASWVEWSCAVKEGEDYCIPVFEWRVTGWGWKFFGPCPIKSVHKEGRGKTDACHLELRGHSKTLAHAKQDCKAAVKVLLSTFRRMQRAACGKNPTPKDQILPEDVGGVFTDCLAGKPLKDNEILRVKWPDGSMEDVCVQMETTESEGGYDERAVVVRSSRGVNATVTLRACTGLRAQRVRKAETR